MKIIETTCGETGNIGFFNWLYKTYGFSITIEQKREALYTYIKKFNINKIEITF